MAIAPLEGASLSMMQPHRPFEGGPAPVTSPDEVKEAGFDSLFLDMVARANTLGNESHQAAEALAAGTNDDVHGTMVEMQKAGIQMRLANSVRNKVVDAFYELWRMSV